ncbi:MAG: hypothetical protein Q4B36_01310 [Tissierellia bacterium]|nr:hypothetical protein [Tissierellia bacterium]
MVRGVSENFVQTGCRETAIAMAIARVTRNYNIILEQWKKNHYTIQILQVQNKNLLLPKPKDIDFMLMKFL